LRQGLVLVTQHIAASDDCRAGKRIKEVLLLVEEHFAAAARFV
jgi:hypothetical protein